MKIGDLTRKLKNKLKLKESPDNRHLDYRLVCSGKIVVLPRLVRITHGSGELPNQEFGHTAKGLGLSEHGLKEMVGCRIDRGCVLICLATELLKFIEQHRQNEGDVFLPGQKAMLVSIEAILAEPEMQAPPQWSSSARDALRRIQDVVQKFAADASYGTVAVKLLARMGDL